MAPRYLARLDSVRASVAGFAAARDLLARLGVQVRERDSHATEYLKTATGGTLPLEVSSTGHLKVDLGLSPDATGESVLRYLMQTV